MSCHLNDGGELCPGSLNKLTAAEFMYGIYGNTFIIITNLMLNPRIPDQESVCNFGGWWSCDLWVVLRFGALLL